MTKKELENTEEPVEVEEVEEEDTEEKEETPEEEEAVEEETEEETEDDVKEELKSFIQSETDAASAKALNKRLDVLSETLAKKFFDGVASQRAKAIASGKRIAKKAVSGEEQVKQWLNALLRKDYSTLRNIQKDYLRTDNTVQGGFLVPPLLLAEINRWTSEYGVARRDMRYLPFSGPGNSRFIPALANSVSVFWVDEAGAKPSTKPTFNLIEQTLEKIAAITPMTEEILEDSAINIIQLLGQLFGEAIAQEEDRVFLNGTSPADPFDGIIRAAGVVNNDLAAAQTPAANADAVVEAMNEIIYTIPTSARIGAKFYMHSTIFSTIQRVRDAVSGQYLIQSPTEGKPGMIWNYPYELVDILPDSTVAAGQNPFLFFGNLNRTCVYGDKAGIKVKLLEEGTVRSAETTPSDLNLATQDMVAFRIVKRVGYVPVLPNGVAVLRTGT